MTRILFALLLLMTAALRPAYAQDAAWVQIEAHPSLTTAEARARAYASNLPDVNGFSLGGGWYAVAIGPYNTSDAEEVLRGYRQEGLIPQDSFIAFTGSFQQQFWPIGANLLNAAPQAIAQAATTQEQTQTQTAEQAPAPEPVIVDETPREARASEAALTRDERKDLQIALQWAGYYNSAIDGAFGRGTRNSMAAWQEANGYEATGVLTTLQRAALFKQYNAVLDGMDLRVIIDQAAGIEMALPLGAVAFDRYESPFAHYEGTGKVDNAKVLLISQEGDQNTLFGLYDIMQTLELVPLDGARERDSNSFVLVGENATFISQTEARLSGGQVKGFTLVWPKGDEERRTRILGEMRASFTPVEGVLDPTAGMDEQQSIDLVSGLRIRTPKLSRSGFYVSSAGDVVTTLEAVESCTRITLDGDYDATVTGTDADLGLALLRPVENLAPQRVAAFSPASGRLGSNIAVAGYPFEGALNAPTLTFGTLADIKGLRGETTLNRLEIEAMSGDIGGPVLNSSGALIGALAPVSLAGRTLPNDVSFSITGAAIAAMLESAGITATASDTTTALAAEDLADLAAEMTVLVSCWE